ncbi:MAG: hypothetical protein L6367_17775 [Cellulomonas sp.]|nr:hypothetical protein [Cellulomonas sp.]
MKSDAEVGAERVLLKRAAAAGWAAKVSANRPEGSPPWGYVFASETDLREARGSWSSLLRLTSST